MADPRLTIARRELAVLRSEKTIVLALLIQLFVAAFSSFMVVGLVSLYDPGSVQGYTVEVGVTGEATDDLMAVVDDRSGLRATAFSSPDDAMAAFRDGDVDAVLETDTRDGRVVVTATAPDSNIRTTLVVVQLQDALRAFERAEREQRTGFLSTQPIDLPPESRSSPYYGFTYTVLLPLLLFLPVFISGSLAVDSITEEFDRGTLELLRVAPVTLTDIVDGKFLAAAGLAPVQAALWIALLRFNGTQIANVAALLVLVAAFAVIVVGLGIAIALLSPDRRAAQFLYSLGVLLVFGATALLPVNAPNTAARLAIDSATGTTLVVVAGYAVAAVVGYAGIRALVARTSVE